MRKNLKWLSEKEVKEFNTFINIGMKLGYYPIYFTEENPLKIIRLTAWVALLTLWLPILIIGLFIVLIGVFGEIYNSI